jgi:hypothetical protein
MQHTPQFRPALVIVVLSLVSHGQYRDGRFVLDLEQRDVAGTTERDDQLPQEWIGVIRLATGKRHVRQQRIALLDCDAGTQGRREVLLGRTVPDPPVWLS